MIAVMSGVTDRLKSTGFGLVAIALGLIFLACGSGAPLEFEEMVSFLKEQGLMIQKIPEQLELVSELPRNPTGKILKHELRKRYA